MEWNFSGLVHLVPLRDLDFSSKLTVVTVLKPPSLCSSHVLQVNLAEVWITGFLLTSKVWLDMQSFIVPI